MKKVVILSLLMGFLGIHASQAQSSNSSNADGFKFGLKAGTNFSNVYDSQGEKFKADGKFGFAGGVFLEIPLGKYLGVRPEILYSQKGFKATGQYVGVNYDFTRTTDYIDIPVLVTIKPISMLTINAGPQFSFLTQKKDVFHSNLLNSQQQEKFSNDNYRKNLMSLTAGVGINLGQIIIDLRANYDMQENHGDGTSTTPRYKNAWYQATVGFRII
jgi:hypothetical protein